MGGEWERTLNHECCGLKYLSRGIYRGCIDLVIGRILALFLIRTPIVPTSSTIGSFAQYLVH